MHYFNVKYIQLLFNLQTAVYYFPYKPRKKRGGGSEEEQTGLETIWKNSSKKCYLTGKNSNFLQTDTDYQQV